MIAIYTRSVSTFTSSNVIYPINHPLKLTHLQTRIDVYKYSFLPQTIIQWNQLQIPFTNIDIDTFKNTLMLFVIAIIRMLLLEGFAN